MDIRERFRRAPISHGAAVVCFLYGAWILAVNGWHYFHGHGGIDTVEFLINGPGGLLVGAIFWSKTGTLVDIALGFAERKAEGE